MVEVHTLYVMFISCSNMVKDVKEIHRMQNLCVVGSGPRNFLANPSRKGERSQVQPQVVVGLERRALQSGAARRAPQEEAQVLMGKCGKKWEASRESSRTPVFGILAYGPTLVSKCDSGHGCRPVSLRVYSSFKQCI